MELTPDMAAAFLARGQRVVEMARNNEIEVKFIKGQKYVLAFAYLVALVKFDPTNFGLIAPEIDDIRQHCDAARLAALPDEYLYEPALIMGPGVTILDGNHRIVRRWDLGERLIPAYRLPDTLTEAVHHMSNRPGAGGPF